MVAFVIFPKLDAARSCDEAITAHKRLLGLSNDFEFHFSKNHPADREAFLKAVTKFEFRTHVLAVNKVRAATIGALAGQSLYEWTAREILHAASGRLKDARVVLDGAGDRNFRRELTARLRKDIATGDEGRAIRSVTLRRSHQDNLLQLADYVAGVAARALSGKRDGDALWRGYLARSADSFRVWPD